MHLKLGRISFLILLVAFFCSPAKANPVQTCNVSASSTTSTSCTLNATTVAAGDLLTCGVMWGNVISGETFAVSDPTNGTYTAITGTPLNDTGPSNSLYGAWVKNSTSNATLTITITMTGSGGSHTIRMGCYEYHSATGWPTNPVDTQAASTCAAAFTCTTSSITPSVTGELVFAAWIMQGTPAASSFTVSAGCAEQDAGGTAGTGWGSQTRATGADNENSGNTSTNCTINWTTTTSGTAFYIVAFKPNAGSGIVSNLTVGGNAVVGGKVVVY